MSFKTKLRKDPWEIVTAHHHVVFFCLIVCGWNFMVVSPVVSRHTFAINGQVGFLDNLKGDYGCTDYFMINIPESYLAGEGFKL